MTDPIRNKLLNWEAAPPPGAWDILARELAEYQAEKSLAERLQSLENPAPPPIWQAIARQISPEAGSAGEIPPFQHPVPVRPLYPYLIRYGAAAILIGFLAWVLLESPFRQPDSITASALPTQHPTSEKLPVEPAAPAAVTTDETAANQELPLVSPLSASFSGKRTDPKREPRHAVIARHQLAAATRPRDRQVFVNKPPTSTIQTLAVQHPDTRYIRITDQNGIPVKISAKFAPLYYLLSNQGSTNPPEFNPSSLDKLERMIIKSSYAPDPANLFDLLRLREILQQEN